jgi:Kef-type K+ transport system membrane component KefB
MSGGMQERKTSSRHTMIVVMVAIAAVLWCVPLALNALLVLYQYRQGTGSLFLIGIGIAPYAVGLLVTLLGPLLLFRANHESAALTVAIVMLAISLPAALLWALGMGST